METVTSKRKSYDSLGKAKTFEIVIDNLNIVNYDIYKR